MMLRSRPRRHQSLFKDRVRYRLALMSRISPPGSYRPLYSHSAGREQGRVGIYSVMEATSPRSIMVKRFPNVSADRLHLAQGSFVTHGKAEKGAVCRISVLSGFWPIVLWLTFLSVLWCLYKSVAVVWQLHPLMT